MVPPASDRISRVPSYSGFLLSSSAFPLPGFHRLWQYFPLLSGLAAFTIMQVLQPRISTVWANSRSLAATWEITFVFFSSGYLDVSVLRVPLLLPG